MPRRSVDPGQLRWPGLEPREPGRRKSNHSAPGWPRTGLGLNFLRPGFDFRQHAERDRGLRIDHVLLNPVLAKRLKKAGVDRWVRLQEKASDHAPAWVEVAAG